MYFSCLKSFSQNHTTYLKNEKLDYTAGYCSQHRRSTKAGHLYPRVSWHPRQSWTQRHTRSWWTRWPERRQGGYRYCVQRKWSDVGSVLLLVPSNVCCSALMDHSTKPPGNISDFHHLFEDGNIRKDLIIKANATERSGQRDKNNLKKERFYFLFWGHFQVCLKIDSNYTSVNNFKPNKKQLCNRKCSAIRKCFFFT